MFLQRLLLPNICFKTTTTICKNYATAGSGSVQPVDLAYDVYESANTNHSKPPLIIMHGLFGSKQNWRGISRALEPKLKSRIYTLDARNHGDSPHTAEHSSKHMAADVQKFMETYRIPKANVMGHSMGGRTMMYFAMKYPNLVNKTIIVDISPISIPRDFSAMQEIFSAMKRLDVPANLSLAQARVQVEKQIKQAVSHKGTVDFIMLNLRKRSTGEFHWAVNVETLSNQLHLFGNFQETIEALAPYKGPVHFINGKHSDFVDPDHWPQILQLFPNATQDWLDAGHLVHFDTPAEFISVVQGFLAN